MDAQRDLSSFLVPPMAVGESSPLIPGAALPPEEMASAEAVLLRLGEALHAAGIPSYRLERALADTAAELGIEAQFFATPTSLFTAIGRGANQRTHLSRVEPGDPDLSQLVELNQLVHRVPKVQPSIEEVDQRLDEILASPKRYGAGATVGAFGLASAGAAVFFGGGLGEVVASLVFGSGLGVLGLVLAGAQASPRVFEALGAFLLTAAATLLAWYAPGISDGVITLASLIVLVPGLTLTVGMSELAMNHWISGTARLAGAFTIFLTIGLGVALGTRVRDLLPEFAPVAQTASDLPPWALWVALCVTPIAFTVLFRARPKDLGWILVAGAFGFFGARFGSSLLGPELGAFLGATAVGLVSNLLARLTHLPAQVPQVPGIILLVPGSIGYQSVSSFLSHDVVSGVEAAFRMVLVGASLVGGLFLSNALLQSRRAL